MVESARSNRYLPANRTGDDTVTIAPQIRAEFLNHWNSFGNSQRKLQEQSNVSLADFIAPKESEKTDYIGAFSVTIEGIEKHIARFMEELDDYNKIILQALADRLAEAFAELLHKKCARNIWDMKIREPDE